MRLPDLLIQFRAEREALERTIGQLSEITGENLTQRPVTGSPRTLPIHEHFAIFRKYIDHEDQLIHERLLWNITIQGFLFAAYGFAVTKLAEIQSKAEGTSLWLLYWFMVLVPVFGILSS